VELAERPRRSTVVTGGREPAVRRVEDGCGGRSYLPSRKSSWRLPRTNGSLARLPTGKNHAASTADDPCLLAIQISIVYFDAKGYNNFSLGRLAPLRIS
jgi:hypothetical protein